MAQKKIKVKYVFLIITKKREILASYKTEQLQQTLYIIKQNYNKKPQSYRSIIVNI